MLWQRRDEMLTSLSCIIAHLGTWITQFTPSRASQSLSMARRHGLCRSLHGNCESCNKPNMLSTPKRYVFVGLWLRWCCSMRRRPPTPSVGVGGSGPNCLPNSAVTGCLPSDALQGLCEVLVQGVKDEQRAWQREGTARIKRGTMLNRVSPY